jgi:hypothetical protein
MKYILDRNKNLPLAQATSLAEISMSQLLQAHANALLYQALKHAPGDRQHFIEQACAERRDLLQLVNTMLSNIDQLDAFLEEPLAAAAEDAATPSRPGAGERIGRWRVVRDIEGGRMGSFLLVENTEGGEPRIAALSIVDASALSLEQLALFQRQRQLLAALTHPDIARLVDSGTLPDGQPYLVMEHSDGEPVDAYCNALGATREARIVLMARACLAVHHAHQHTVLHRHLGPSSILVDHDGRLKLTDVGAGCLFDGGDAAATTADDILALGTVLRKLLLDAGGALPPALEQIVAQATDPDPQARHGSADQLAEALLRHLDPPRLALADLPEPQLAPPRRAPGKALGAALLVALGALAMLGWQHLRRAPAAPAAATASSSAVVAAQAAPAATPPGDSAGAAARHHLALADSLVAQRNYAAADTQFKLARDAYAALPTGRLMATEAELARAEALVLREHWRTAGQAIRALRAGLPQEASPLLRARAAFLEALIQPGGTAAQAYAAARKNLPVLLAHYEADPANIPQLRASALAWRRIGDIAARAGQRLEACGWYGKAEQRYAELEKGGRAEAPDRAARAQLSTLRAGCA